MPRDRKRLWWIALLVALIMVGGCLGRERESDERLWLSTVSAKRLGIIERRFLALKVRSSSPIAWSPDGREIAYLRANSPRIYNLETDEIRKLVIGRSVGGVAPMGWSPDGKYFAFSLEEWGEGRMAPVRREIGVVDMETGEFRQLTDTSAEDGEWGIWFLEWAPEGHRMVSSDNYRILNPETMKWEEPSPCEGDIQLEENRVGGFTIWSSNGLLIGRVVGSIVESEDIPKDIQLDCLGEGEWKQVLAEGIQSDSTTLAPEFSPDGSKIAWMEQERVPGGPTKRRLMVMDSTGGVPKLLIADDELGGARFTGAWAWSPDGRRIAAVVGEKEHGIYIFTLGEE